MKKTIILALAMLALGGAVSGQQLVTIAAGQSASPVYDLQAYPGYTAPYPAVITGIYPPAALDANSDGVEILVCRSINSTACLPMYDANGTLLRFKITGGATPTGAIQIDPPSAMPGLRYYKLQVVTSANAAQTQAAARQFLVFGWRQQ